LNAGRLRSSTRIFAGVFALYGYRMDNYGLRYPEMGAVTLTADLTDVYSKASGRTLRTQQPSISPALNSTPTQTVFMAEINCK
jgi:hypothetical protein